MKKTMKLKPINFLSTEKMEILNNELKLPPSYDISHLASPSKKIKI